MHRTHHDNRRRDATRRGLALAAALVLGVAGSVGDASAAGQVGNYFALKGGIYSPSAEFDLGNINAETTFDGDTETGFAGELAYGHYFSPSFALEAGLGYFNAKAQITEGTTYRGQLDYNVIPLLLSAKVFVPVGSVFPYGEFGVGAYFSAFDVSDNANSFEGTTTFGVHAGAGINVDVSSRVFIGLEARYVWNDPSFGDQDVNLNGDDYNLDGFKLNGFTTMAVLGLYF